MVKKLVKAGSIDKFLSSVLHVEPNEDDFIKGVAHVYPLALQARLSLLDGHASSISTTRDAERTCFFRLWYPQRILVVSL